MQQRDTIVWLYKDAKLEGFRVAPEEEPEVVAEQGLRRYVKNLFGISNVIN